MDEEDENRQAKSQRVAAVPTRHRRLENEAKALGLQGVEEAHYEEKELEKTLENERRGHHHLSRPQQAKVLRVVGPHFVEGEPWAKALAKALEKLQAKMLQAEEAQQAEEMRPSNSRLAQSERQTREQDLF